MFNHNLLNPVVKHNDHNKACMDTWSALEKRLEGVCDRVNVQGKHLWKFTYEKEEEKKAQD